MKATLAQPARAAASATPAGDAAADSAWSSLAFEMSQFWQKRQPRLQPAVPNDSTLDPG